jgi:hypothetical protein
MIEDEFDGFFDHPVLRSVCSLESQLFAGRKSLNPRVALKFEVVYLWLFVGKSQGQICKKTGLSRNTVKSYIRQYENGGIESLKMFYKKYYDTGLSNRPL